MKSQQTHRKNVTRTFHNSIEADNFIPMHLTTKALSDDSCWDEIDADYEESFSAYDLTYLDDVTCN